MTTTITRFEAAYQQLRQMLIDRRYLPKERLIEAELVNVLGVSRSTVRSVLIRLEQEELVEIEPNRGARVSTLTLDEAVQLFEVREVLEGLIARVAASEITPAQSRRLASLYADMERALDADDPFRYAELNRDFHQLIADAAGGHRAVKALMGLPPQVVRQQFQTVLLPGRRDRSLGEHLHILRALEARDPERAEATAREHARAVRDSFARSGARAHQMAS